MAPLLHRPNRGNSEAGLAGLLRAAALIAVLAGASLSIGLMLRVGHRQRSVFLLLLFTIWVLSPFVGLFWVNWISTRWAFLTRVMVYSLTLVLTLGSLAIYGSVAFGPPRAQPASRFLVVPLASWLLIAIVIPLAARSGRSGRRHAN